MKKIVLVLFAVLLLSLSLFACDKEDKEIVNVSVSTPDGAPTLALAELIATNPEFAGYAVDYGVVMSDASTEAATVIGAKLVSGDLDMAIIPTNLAATLYNKGANIKLVSVNTWGNLYVVSKAAAISDLNALKGKVVYTVSQSGPPLAVLKYLLTRAGIAIASDTEYEVDAGGIATAVADKVVIKYMPATTMIPNLKQNKIEYGLLGEPAVTNALKALGEGANIALDLQYEWKKATGNDSYAQASLVANGDFLEHNKDFVNAFVEKLNGASEWLKATENITAAKAAFIEKAPSTALANISADTVARCGIECKTAATVKDTVKKYLGVFNLTVDDDFFYVG